MAYAPGDSFFWYDACSVMDDAGVFSGKRVMFLCARYCALKWKLSICSSCASLAVTCMSAHRHRDTIQSTCVLVCSWPWMQKLVNISVHLVEKWPRLLKPRRVAADVLLFQEWWVRKLVLISFSRRSSIHAGTGANSSEVAATLLQPIVYSEFIKGL